MFFKFLKDKKTEDLTLKDYDKIWTKFCFLDETGTLSNKTDEYFTVGILKMSQPYYLQNKLIFERNKARFHDEMKFNKASKNNVEFIKKALDALFETKSISFYSYTISTRSKYYLENFNKNPWLAYEEITLKLLDQALLNQEIIILIADHVTTPKEIKFEVNSKKNFNSHKKRLALAGVCRIDSKANDLLQVVDILIGAVTYNLKLKNKIVSGSKFKIEILDYIKKKMRAEDLVGNLRNGTFNIFMESAELEVNEKGLSS